VNGGAIKGSGVASDQHGTLIFAPYGTLTPGNNDRLWNISSLLTQFLGGTGGILKGATKFAAQTTPTLTQGQWLLVAEVSYPGGYGYFDWARVASSTASDNLATGTYTSGITATGAAGQTCNLGTFNNGLGTATAVIYLTGTNAIAGSTPFYVTTPGTGATNPPTSAVATNGSATCSGTVVVSTSLGTTVNTVQPFRTAFPDTAPAWTGSMTLTQVAKVGSIVTYTYSAFSGQLPWPGSMITISGFTNSGNNGTFKVNSIVQGTSGTFTATLQGQVNETHAGSGASPAVGNQGLIYFAVTPGSLIDGFYLRNFKVIAPVMGVGSPIIFNFQGTVNPRIENTVLDTPSAQGLEWFMNRGGKINGNTWNTYGEVPSSVDVDISQNIFDAAAGELTAFGNSCPGHPTTTSLDLDLGLGFFTFTDNSIKNYCNSGVTLFNGIHDGVVRGNRFAYSNTGSNTTDGIVMIGGYNNHITQNVLAGQTGTTTTGIVTEDSLLYGINSSQNVVRNNIIVTGGFNTRFFCQGTLGNDAVWDIDDTGTEQQLCGGGAGADTITIGPATGPPPLNGLNYRGNTTSGEQLLFGSNLAGASFTSAVGTKFSSGALFFGHNAVQTTTNLDLWSQPYSTSRSTYLGVDALNGLQYCFNSSGASNAAFASFFTTCPIQVAATGTSRYDSVGASPFSINMDAGSGTSGVQGGDGTGSGAKWGFTGAGAGSAASYAATGAVTAATETSTGTNQSADQIVTSLGNSTQPPCPNGTSNKLTLSGCVMPLNVELFSVTQISPVAAATYYVGIGGAAINGSAAQQVPFWVPRAGTVTFAHLGCQVAGTLDTGANTVTATITDANGTNFTDTQVTFNLQARLGDGTATGSDAVVAGHKILLKLVMPASWTTQPTLVTCSANFQYN
jgi:hypothetical protein